MRIYGLSKARALFTGTIFTLFCLFLLLVHAGGCIIYFLPTVIWCWLSYYKHWKLDQDILAAKQEEEAHTFSRTEPQHAVLPPQASKGSNGQLFIPPPLERDSGRMP